MLPAVMPSRTRERTFGDGDELPFGDFCFSCGNATEGSSYCSPECREEDARQAPLSPEFSPYLSPVPPLVSSAKSTCSTPPSSATNSPLQSPTNDLADPPSLDLPPAKHGFFAHSLPTNGMKLAATWTINYQPESLVSPMVTPSDALHQQANDLSYRRKTNRPHPSIPSPLYFRQKAAAVHSSPALNPTSPANAHRTPSFGFDTSGANIHDDDITDLALPQRQHETLPRQPAIVPTPSHCGRPGCIGVPKKLKVDTSADRKSRRKSWQPSPTHGFKGFTPIESPNSTDDVLLSPRIRTLRTGRSASDEGPGVRSKMGREEGGSDSDSSGDDAHSAFACYLFSHLADPSAPTAVDGRGRPSETVAEEMKRSRSADGSAVSRPGVTSSATPARAPATPGRPTRTLFSRGPGVQSRPETPVDRLTPLESTTESEFEGEDDDNTPTVVTPSRLNGRTRARDDTIRASALPPSLTTRGRPSLLPGHFIEATTDSPSSSAAASPIMSTPATPPTVGRGRSSSSRRHSVEGVKEDSRRGRGRNVSPGVEASSIDPRGRSKLRGTGAVRRTPSPEARVESEERPTRSSSRSRSSRPSRSRGRGCREETDETPRVRGRTRERVIVDEYDGDTERGRGRGRESVSRSKSRLRRARGREVIYSGGAYGHIDSSDSDH